MMIYRSAVPSRMAGCFKLKNHLLLEVLSLLATPLLLNPCTLIRGFSTLYSNVV